MPTVGQTDEPQWPPRSPHEALLSTPSGREKLRRLAERSPSASPSKLRTSRTMPALTSRSTNAGFGAGLDDEDDEDDDEETLQLKLQEIQARLKLKKLQNAKANARPPPPPPPPPLAVGAENGTLRTTKSAGSHPPPQRLAQRPQQENSVEVPASPNKRVQQSPKRVHLGIDKGLKAQDVSLKRASSVRSIRHNQDSSDGPQLGAPRYLQRSRTPGVGGTRDDRPPTTPPRPLSFSERLANARTEEASKLERQARVQKARSNAFSLSKDEMEGYKASAVDLPDLPDRPQTYSRAEILGAGGRTSSAASSGEGGDGGGRRGGGGGGGGGYLKRSNTAPSIRFKPKTGADSGSDSGSRSPQQTQQKKQQQQQQQRGKTAPAAETAEGQDEASFESYSGLHLRKRIIPHHALTRIISGKKIYLLKDFLQHVKAPDWSLPDEECDIVLFAILASKSDPRSHKPNANSGGPGGSSGDVDKDKDKSSDRGKYMVMKLVDLVFEVELFLFNSGFDRFWKLTPGTVLAILNPGIMPPPKGREATGKFGLVINSDCDTILEVGTARDLGYCNSTRRDGTRCPSWVNARRTEHCEFHSNEAVRRVASGRAELSGSAGFGFAGDINKIKGTGPFDSTKPWKHNSRVGAYASKRDQAAAKAQREKDAEERARLGRYDRETGSRLFVSRAASAASLLDREGEFENSIERKEALKRRLAEREREHELRRKLGELGGGAGREYMMQGGQQQGQNKNNNNAATLGSSTSSRSLLAPSSSIISSSHNSSSIATTLAPEGGGGAAALLHNAAAQDLLYRAKSAAHIDLGPASKRKRPDSSTSNSTAAGGTGTVTSRSTAISGGGGKITGPVGWGSVLKNKLGKMKEGQSVFGEGSRPKGQLAITESLSLAAAPTTASATRDDRSPVRKKTRFVTEKGIREAGRESLGTELPSATAVAATNRLRRVVVDEDDDDDEDELVIV